MTNFTDCLSSFLHALQQGAPLGTGDATRLQPLLHQPPHPLALLQAGFTHTQNSRQQPQEAFTTHCLQHQHRKVGHASGIRSPIGLQQPPLVQISGPRQLAGEEICARRLINSFHQNYIVLPTQHA